ncbi:Acetyltransferase (GNAT) family protein [Tranquillimonas rosea]|uniref:Acetyltransferase (GNAT) family protein n=1 Tax=Tranquillimonas rosea TaxID=641238 RepID=A0A1H9RRW2_9RHOB|nr:GNAT family N-acetyltransferase [Tranquillimonas rosea]SER75552.1 Acetyltransferase (GNAT) family protein [Tranquillimonas rosea]
MSLRFETLTGAEVERALDDLARLRIDVFRDWPYLYDGDLGYEREYMATYQNARDAILVGAFDGDRLVGAATGTPMEDHADDFAKPLEVTGLDVGSVFYCAESVLLPAYRGQGAGRAFFEAREEHARALGRTHSMFCAVIRPENHPQRPTDYVPLDDFWRRRGYAPVDGAVATFAWRDVGDAQETDKPLQVWLKRL